MDFSRQHAEMPLLDPLEAFVDSPEATPPPSAVTAPSTWFGTPMEMVADAFGMDRPWRHADDNRKAHKRNVAAKRARRDKLAKASRKRNRR